MYNLIRFIISSEDTKNIDYFTKLKLAKYIYIIFILLPISHNFIFLFNICILANVKYSPHSLDKVKHFLLKKIGEKRVGGEVNG